MYVTCLDLEGVLVPEIWIAFAEKTGISELRRTTRDEPDYDALMHYRIAILKAHNLGLRAIQEVIAEINPYEGAKDFLDALRSECQVLILSDTFTQFASPLMKKLAMPTIFCNSLIIDDDGMISSYKLRQKEGKLHAVTALQSIGFKTIAAGDSFNDLAMIKQAEAGFFFKPPARIAHENPHIPVFTEFAPFLQAIQNQLRSE